MTQPQDGEWYQASDGNWYCWPNPTPYPAPPAAPVPPPPPGLPVIPTAPEMLAAQAPAPELPSWLAPQSVVEPPAPVAPQGSWDPGAQAGWSPGAPAPGWSPPAYSGPPAPVTQPWPAYALLGFGVLLLVSVLLPWVSIDAGFISESENGFGSGFNGIVLLIGGGLAIASAVTWLQGQRKANVGWGAAFSGLIDVVFSIEDLLDVRGAINEAKEFVSENAPGEFAEQIDELISQSVSTGFGLYLAVFAALGIVGSSIWLALTTPDS